MIQFRLCHELARTRTWLSLGNVNFYVMTSVIMMDVMSSVIMMDVMFCDTPIDTHNSRVHTYILHLTQFPGTDKVNTGSS